MWQLAEARNRFSEVFSRAISEGPQTITRRGEKVLVISAAEYARLGGGAAMTLGDYLLRGPSLEGVDLTRDRSEGRAVDLG